MLDHRRRPGQDDEPIPDELVDLLDGAAPDTYVIIRWSELASLIVNAFRNTDSRGRHQPHRAVVRLGLSLQGLGHMHRVRQR